MSTHKSRLRRDVEQTPSAEKRFYRKNDEVVARIRELKEQQGLTQEELAEEMEKKPSYISRVLGGGVNLTLKTIAEFEEALGDDILAVPESSSVQSTTRRRRYEVDEQYTEMPIPSGGKSRSSCEGPSSKQRIQVIEQFLGGFMFQRGGDRNDTNVHTEGDQ